MLSCALTVFDELHTEGLSIMEASVAAGAVWVCCGSLSVVSQLADRPWSLGSCTPALTHTSAWQAKLLKGRTRTGWLRLAQLTHEMKTQCYRSATASLMSECFINKRQVTSSAWIICLDSPPRVVKEEAGADLELNRGLLLMFRSFLFLMSQPTHKTSERSPIRGGTTSSKLFLLVCFASHPPCGQLAVCPTCRWEQIAARTPQTLPFRRREVCVSQALTCVV